MRWLITAALVAASITMNSPGGMSTSDTQATVRARTRSLTFRRPDDGRPACTDVPFGFALTETRAQARAHAGEPQWQGARGNVAIWRFGPLELHIAYDTHDVPLVVRVFPRGLIASFRYFG